MLIEISTIRREALGSTCAPTASLRATMGRLGELDLPDRLAPSVPRWATSMAVGLLADRLRGACALHPRYAGARCRGLRLGLPPRWWRPCSRAGWPDVTASVVSILFAWYYLFPIRNSFRFETSAQAVTMGSVATIRRDHRNGAGRDVSAARCTAATQERDRADRRARAVPRRVRAPGEEQLHARSPRCSTCNAAAPATARLPRRSASALARVESIARAHRHLYRGGSDAGHGRLGRLSARTVQRRFPRRCSCAARSCSNAIRIMPRCPRDRAVSIGLIVNELVTNAAKHAFGGREHRRDFGAVREAGRRLAADRRRQWHRDAGPAKQKGRRWARPAG